MLVAFIRHGESELNRQGVLDGNSEAGLTEQGILQCMQLGQWIRHNLAEEAVIFSSPMRRARDPPNTFEPQSQAKFILMIA